MKNPIRILLLSFVIFINIGCDQVSKNVVRKTIIEGSETTIMNNMVLLTKVENPGAAMSLWADMPYTFKVIFLQIIPFLVMIFLFWRIISRKFGVWYSLGFATIIGGGLGNLYDRVFIGTVTDFLQINIGFFHTGIFNMADVSIMLGMFIVFFQILTKREKSLI